MYKIFQRFHITDVQILTKFESNKLLSFFGSAFGTSLRNINKFIIKIEIDDRCNFTNINFQSIIFQFRCQYKTVKVTLKLHLGPILNGFNERDLSI